MPPCEGGYKEFKIGDLFDGKYGDTDIQAKHVNGLGVDIISSGTKNNGIIGKTDLPARIFPKNTITIDMFGNCFFQPNQYKLVTHARIFSLNWKNGDMNEYLGLYLSAMFAYLPGIYSYNNMCSWEKIKDSTISLPITSIGEIDFQYIESRIRELEEERMRELEEERMRELEAYLTAAGFADCSLTPAEEEALRKFSNGEVKFTSYRIGDHFKKLALGMHKKFNKSTDVSKESNAEFNIPLVNAKHGNNGIMYYGKECDYDTAEMTIDVVNDGAVSTGDVYAQPQKTGVLYNAYLIKCISHELDTNSIFYFSTAIGKSIKMKYGYDKKASWERVQNDSMILPTTPEGKIDYDFMETYISAIKKQIIQQLKDFITKERVAYQQVIND